MGNHSRKFLAVSGFLGVMLLLGGCSASEPQVIDESKYEDLYDDETSDDAQSDDESEELDDEDVPYPPELPEAVKDESEDGAIAAVEYFLDAYEYTYRTADSSYLDPVTGDECKTCENIHERFTAHQRKGRKAPKTSFTNRKHIGTVTNQDGKFITFEVRLVDATIRDSDGGVYNAVEDDDYSLVFSVERKSDLWVITGADFEKVNDVVAD